jgi:hypothetical protein
LVVQLELEFILALSDQEVPDGLWNGIFDTSKNNSEVGVDPSSKISDKTVWSTHSSADHLLWRLLLLLNLTLTAWLTTWPVISFNNDGLLVLLVVKIVGEQIVLFGVNDSLDDLSGVVSLLRDTLDDHIHNLRYEGWEPLEDLLNYGTGNLLELLVGVLDQLEGWVSQLLKLRVDKVNEHINRWETGKTISFVHLNGFLDIHVVVLRCSLVALEFLIEVVEVKLDLGTTA